MMAFDLRRYAAYMFSMEDQEGWGDRPMWFFDPGAGCC
jgi:hypothetical protein